MLRLEAECSSSVGGAERENRQTRDGEPKSRNDDVAVLAPRRLQKSVGQVRQGCVHERYGEGSEVVAKSMGPIVARRGSTQRRPASSRARNRMRRQRQDGGGLCNECFRLPSGSSFSDERPGRAGFREHDWPFALVLATRARCGAVRSEAEGGKRSRSISYTTKIQSAGRGLSTHLAARHFALFSLAGVLDPSAPFVAEPTLSLPFATGTTATRPRQQVLLETLLCLSELHKLFRLLELVVAPLTGPSPVKDGHGDLDRLGPESRDRMVELSRVHDRGVDSWLLERLWQHRSRLTSGSERFASGEMGGEGSDLFPLGGRLVYILELVQ